MSREHIEKDREFIAGLESRCPSNQRVLDPIDPWNLQISVTFDTDGLDVLVGTCLLRLVQHS